MKWLARSLQWRHVKRIKSHHLKHQCIHGNGPTDHGGDFILTISKEDGPSHRRCTFYMDQGPCHGLCYFSGHNQKHQLVFSTHGLPETIVSDNGTLFMSDMFAVLVRQNGIKHLTSAPYHPASNGLAERVIQTLKNALKKNPGEVSLPTQIYRFLFQYRLTPHSTTGIAPAESILGQRHVLTSTSYSHAEITDRVRNRK